jgi:predicted transposase/invertase (TIGR01784 family)
VFSQHKNTFIKPKTYAKLVLVQHLFETERVKMVFMDPTSDIAFKKLFANKEKPEILISFLNSVLALPEGQKITNLTLNDPNNLPDLVLEKHSIVDVSCTDQAGKNYIVEMQLIDQKDYAERCQFYASFGIVRQLKKGGIYKNVKPVIFVGILNFKLFKGENCVSHHLILDTQTHEHKLLNMSFHFIELPKFNKKAEELNDVVDKWIYLLKNADAMDSIPKKLENPLEVEEALDILKQGNWSSDELWAYHKYLDRIRVERSVYETMLEKGMEKGMEKGVAKGKKEAAIEHAKKLLPLLDVKIIAQITELSSEEIENLKKQK